MELHHVRNQTADSADIFLFNQIGNGGINATDFVNELRYLDTLGLKSINVRINSGGGSVIEGYGIFAAIRAINTPVNTIIEGIAASIAGIIAMAGKKRSISDFGRLMIHDPSFGSSRPDNKQQAALDTLKSSLTKILSNNSSLDEAEVGKLMSKETWFNAEEALAFGFVDKTFSTARKEAKNELTVVDIENLASDLLEPNNKKPINKNMLNLTNHLSLEDKATEGEVLEAVKTIENNLTEATNKVTDLETAHATAVEVLENAATEATAAHTTVVDGLNDNVTALNKEVATLVVENAINAGKFSKEKKEELIVTATKDLEAFKNICNSVTVAPTSITSLLNKGKAETTDKDWDHMTKKEPKALNEMRINDVEAYNKLFAAKFGTETK